MRDHVEGKPAFADKDQFATGLAVTNIALAFVLVLVLLVHSMALPSGQRSSITNPFAKGSFVGAEAVPASFTEL